MVVGYHLSICIVSGGGGISPVDVIGILRLMREVDNKILTRPVKDPGFYVDGEVGPFLFHFLFPWVVPILSHS